MFKYRRNKKYWCVFSLSITWRLLVLQLIVVLFYVDAIGSSRRTLYNKQQIVAINPMMTSWPPTTVIKMTSPCFDCYLKYKIWMNSTCSLTLAQLVTTKQLLKILFTLNITSNRTYFILGSEWPRDKTYKFEAKTQNICRNLCHFFQQMDQNSKFHVMIYFMLTKKFLFLFLNWSISVFTTQTP